MNNGLIDSLNFSITNALKLNNYRKMIKGLESFLNHKNVTILSLNIEYNWVLDLEPWGSLVGVRGDKDCLNLVIRCWGLSESL